MSFVGSEIVKAGGIVLACPIAPHEEARVWARDAIQKTGGGFCLVHISTSFEDCEKRDRKGLYKKARDGLLKGLTGTRMFLRYFFLIIRAERGNFKFLLNSVRFGRPIRDSRASRIDH